MHCWCVGKLAQLLWKTVWSFLKNLKIELLYDIGSSRLWRKWKHKGKIYIHPMFIHNIIHNSQDIKTTKAPIDEWTVKENIVYIFIYIMEYYSAIKNNEILPFTIKWTELEGIMLSEINQRKIKTVCFNLHVKSRKQKTKPL